MSPPSIDVSPFERFLDIANEERGTIAMLARSFLRLPLHGMAYEEAARRLDDRLRDAPELRPLARDRRRALAVAALVCELPTVLSRLDLPDSVEALYPKATATILNHLTSADAVYPTRLTTHS